MEKSSTILLVEDHHLSAKIVKNILSTLNCQVDIAMDGKTTLEMFQTKPYDLIFMDIGLPDMSGYEITRRIRSYELDEKRTPIVALTAHADSKNEKQCFDVAMNAVINKPLTREKAGNVLNKFILGRGKQLEPAAQNEYPNTDGRHEEKIVDFEYTKKLLGSNELAVHEMLAMLVDSLPHEVKKLEAAYQHGDWESIKVIAHRLKGGSSYCGTLSLKSACTKLEDYIGSGLTMQIPGLYQKLLSEIAALQKFLVP